MAFDQDRTRTDIEDIAVAVIGTGLAGLSTAYLLQTLPFTTTDGSAPRFSVHLYDRSATHGMDSSSITVPAANAFRLDTPMRSINGGGSKTGSHHRVWALYEHLRINLRRAEFSYSFSRLSHTLSVPARSSSPPPPYVRATPLASSASPPPTRPLTPAQTPLFLYNGANGFSWPPLHLPSTVTTLSAKAFYLVDVLLLALSYIQLVILALFYTQTGLTHRPRMGTKSIWELAGCRNVSAETLDTWCDRHRIGVRMRREILEPLYGAISTVGKDEAGALPVAELLEYIVATFGNSHFVTRDGVRQVVDRLAAPLSPDQLHLATTITAITPTPGAAHLTRLHYTTTGSDDTAAVTSHRDFHYVICATQANQAQKLVRMYQSAVGGAVEEKAVQGLVDALGTFSYVTTLVVNHWDTSILPSDESDRRDLNLASFATADAKGKPSGGSATTLPRTSIQATHIISRTHPALTKDLARGQELLQTTNPMVPIRPDLVLSSNWYERAKATLESKAILPRFILPAYPSVRPASTESGLSAKGVGHGEGDLQHATRNILFVGSYCADGIPLLEGCVVSAERAVAEIARRESVWAPLPF